MHFAIWTNAFCNLDKYILQFGQIHFAIWTNTFSNLDKYHVNCRDTAGICGGWLKSMVASLYYSTLPVSPENYPLELLLLLKYDSSEYCHISAFDKQQNIATGETPPAITPFHFFGYSNFSNFHHLITFIT